MDGPLDDTNARQAEARWGLEGSVMEVSPYYCSCFYNAPFPDHCYPKIQPHNLRRTKAAPANCLPSVYTRHKFNKNEAEATKDPPSDQELSWPRECNGQRSIPHPHALYVHTMRRRLRLLASSSHDLTCKYGDVIFYAYLGPLGFLRLLDHEVFRFSGFATPAIGSRLFV